MQKRRSLQWARIEYVWAIWDVSAISCHLVSYQSHWVRSFLFSSVHFVSSCWLLTVLCFSWLFVVGDGFFFIVSTSHVCVRSLSWFCHLPVFLRVFSLLWLPPFDIRYRDIVVFHLVVLLLLVIFHWFLVYIGIWCIDNTINMHPKDEITICFHRCARDACDARENENIIMCTH